MALLLAAPQTATARILIVESSGENARSRYPRYTQLPDDTVFNLRIGDALRVLARSGAAMLVGPGRFRIGERRPGSSVIFNFEMQAASPAEQLYESLYRPYETNVIVPNSFDVTAGGTVCAVELLPLFARYPWDHPRQFAEDDDPAHGLQFQFLRRDEGRDAGRSYGGTVRNTPTGRFHALRVSPSPTADLDSNLPVPGRYEAVIVDLDAESGRPAEFSVEFEFVMAPDWIRASGLTGEGGDPASIAEAFLELGCTSQIEPLFRFVSASTAQDIVERVNDMPE